MIKLSQAMPDIVPDGTNPEATKEFLIAVKQCIEELANKAKSLQAQVRTSVPSSADIETEGEDVRYNTGGVRRTYTKLDGEIRYHVET